MKSPKKKELRQATEDTLRDLLAKHEIASPSKRTKKILIKASKRISNQLMQEIKKQFKLSEKAKKKVKTDQHSEAA
jgi:parvulin-like peptidyl-prolyl isomerase